MRRTREVLALATALGVLSAGLCFANIPDPSLSDVPNVVGSPQGTLPYTVTVVGSQGPVDTALVEIVFDAAADALVCWCTGQAHPVISGVTNAAGQVTFFIEAGGCVDPARLGSTVAEVYANGILLNSVGLTSPDAVDGTGNLPTDGGYATGGVCTVGLSDATFHTGPISSGTYEFCSDMDSDLGVALADAVLLTTPISSGETCSE